MSFKYVTKHYNILSEFEGYTTDGLNLLALKYARSICDAFVYYKNQLIIFFFT